MAKAWIINDATLDESSLALHWRVPPLIARLLANRGFDRNDSVESFLSPRLKDLHSPGALPGAEAAAGIITDAIRAQHPIVLYGDYDVDGTTGVAILWRVLHDAGAKVSCYVPHRVEEGFGLSAEATRRLIAEGAALLISVDCGITATEVAAEIAETDARLIVADHHAPRADLPRAAAIVHPTAQGDYPNPNLCGAGVAFKLAWAIAQQLSGAERVDDVYRQGLMDVLPLAALGTIADVVPLTGENRILARQGLERMAGSPLAGLRALLSVTGLAGRPIDGQDVAFKLAPRINAAGRMGHARIAVEMFTTADEHRAREIALQLEGQNRMRREEERTILAKAVEMIETGRLAGDAHRAIVLAHAKWHVGVIGIVAARLVERYARPTVLIALAGRDSQGSGRSVRHFDMNAALGACGQHLISYGGHEMAAGLRIDAKQLDDFTDAFLSEASQRLTGKDVVRKLRLDATVSLRDLSLSTVEAVLALGPFGAGNPKPRLATDWIDLAAEPRLVGQRGDHLQAVFQQDGINLKAIGFGLADRMEDLKQHRRCRVAFEPLINEFNGRRTVEMRILDLQFPK